MNKAIKDVYWCFLTDNEEWLYVTENIFDKMVLANLYGHGEAFEIMSLYEIYKNRL